MTAATDTVSLAIDRMNKIYLPTIRKRLDHEDRCGSVTLTVNPTELRILKVLVTDRLHELRNDWYNTTHDKSYTDITELAYSLSLTEVSQRQIGKLLTKLDKADPNA